MTKQSKIVAYLVFFAAILQHAKPDNDDGDNTEKLIDDLKEDLNKKCGKGPECVKMSSRLDDVKREVRKNRRGGGGDSGSSEKIGECVSTIKDNLDNFKSGDTEKIMKGVLEVAAAMSEFLPPPADMIFSSLFSIASGFLAKKAKTKSMADIVREVVKDELKNARFDELTDEFIGAEMTLNVMQVMLRKALEKQHEMTVLDVDYLNSQVSATAGIRVMGMLRNIATRSILKANNFETVEQVTTAIHLYVSLSSLRLMLLMDARMFYKEYRFTRSSHDILDAVIASVREQDKAWLDFIQNPQNLRHPLVTLMLFHKREKYADTLNYLKSRLDIDIYRTNTELAQNSDYPGRKVELTLDSMFETKLCFRKLDDVRGDVLQMHNECKSTEGIKMRLVTEKGPLKNMLEAQDLNLISSEQTGTEVVFLQRIYASKSYFFCVNVTEIHGRNVFMCTVERPTGMPAFKGYSFQPLGIYTLGPVAAGWDAFGADTKTKSFAAMSPAHFLTDEKKANVFLVARAFAIEKKNTFYY